MVTDCDALTMLCFGLLWLACLWDRQVTGDWRMEKGIERVTRLKIKRVR